MSESTKIDINLIDEDNPKTITYSRALVLTLSRLCRNNCGYCGFNGPDRLTVPYTMIRKFKEARNRGVSDVMFQSGERPDKFNDVRAILDLWGFESFEHYIYTVCELAFLEGLLPNIEVGFLSAFEIKGIRDMIATAKVMIDAPSSKLDHTDVHRDSPGKKLDLRLRSLSYLGKLKVPTSTGILIGAGESKEHRKYAVEAVRSMHKEFGHIHDFAIANIIPQKGTPLSQLKPVNKKELLATIEMAREILPEDIPIGVQPHTVVGFMDLISAGVRDFGRFGYEDIVTNIKGKWPKLSQVESQLHGKGYKLQERLPLRVAFIKKGWYSRKIGQILDAYRYKIKKDESDRAGSAGRGAGRKRKVKEETDADPTDNK